MTRISGCRFAAIVGFFVLALAGSSHGEPFHSAQYGYDVAVPADWVVVPSYVLKGTMEAVRNPNSKSVVIYDTAFQPASNPDWMIYPYVVVQVVPYSRFGLKQINEDQFAEVTKAITGVDLSKRVEPELAPEARSLISGASFGKSELDMARRRYSVTISMNVDDTPVRGLMAGYFGRDALVQVNAYGETKDWDRHAAAMQSIIDSFRFDPARDYSVAFATANPSPRSVWGNVLEKGLVGAMVGGVLALMSYLFSRAKRSNKTGGPSAT